MATIVTIAASDQITNSRADINTNFANLNSDKIETSVIDTDTALTANSDAKIPSQKAIKAYVDAQSILTVSSESTTAATHSLTTIANQRVVVWAKGDVTGAVPSTITLDYNSVTKDTVVTDAGGAGDKEAFSLMYTETPGAATQNITVAASGGATLANVKIMVMKFNV